MSYNIDISQCTYTIYHFNTKRSGQFIPTLVVHLPVSLSEVQASGQPTLTFTGVSGRNGGVAGRDLGMSNIALPFWTQTISGSEDTYLSFLNVYQNDNPYVFYYEEVQGRFVTATIDVMKYAGSTSRKWSESRALQMGYDRAFAILITFIQFSSGEFIIDSRIPCGASYINDSLITTVVPEVAKGTYDASSATLFDNLEFPITQWDTPNAGAIREWLKMSKVYDKNDPNPGGGDSKPGGGGGDGDIGGDTNPDDGLPTISALDSGLLTAYNPTVAELQSLGRFLWSDSFDISTFKKLFNDPFDTLLGLSVVPVKPNTSHTQSIMFGNMDSGISAPVVSNQWVSKDMGSVVLNETWKGALDYAPSTSVTIYLPFIGMKQLNVNDVMGSSLHLIYKFDVLTGSCIAQLYVNHSSQGNKNDGFSWTKDQGLLYEFIGQCAENIPLASQDFTNTIRAAIGGVAVATGAAASIATGNPALGIAGLTVGAANLGMQASTPTVERGGHLSGSASILGYSQPFLIVERPHQCKPSRYYALRGVPSQVYTSKLSNCTNFTQITANNNLHIAGASDSELTELQNLLVAGVYFPNKKR